MGQASCLLLDRYDRSGNLVLLPEEAERQRSERLAARLSELGEDLMLCKRSPASKAILEHFPNNFTVIQLFAFLNTARFSGETSKRWIQALALNLAAVDVITDDEIQELGEDLTTDLGRAMETKIRVSQVKTRLENLQ